MADKSKKKIIVVGAGFAGLKLINLLKNSDFEITLIDKNNYHEFAPLFYQIASSGLEPGSICFPVRKELRGISHIHFRMCDLLSINTIEHKVLTDGGEFLYDYLVIATGTTTKFFGKDDIRDFSFTLKSTSEGLLLRNQILACLEKASECPDTECRKRMLTFVISGGGPAGVEMAGAIGEMKKYIIQKEYPEIDPSEMRIRLVEPQAKVLATMSENASQSALKFLHELDVDVDLGVCINSFDGATVTTSTGELIATDTLIWSAGVEGRIFEGIPKECYGGGNRLIVNECNQLVGHSEIFAIGDCCIMPTDEKPKGDPQVAQVAIQQAANLANNLKYGDMKLKFSYKDKGAMATIGRNRAVADLKIHKFAGQFAWWLWLLVHLLTLIGFQKKIITMVNWTWNYFYYNSSLRILVRESAQGKRPTPECGECVKKDEPKEEDQQT